MAKVHFTITLAGRDEAENAPTPEERKALRQARREGWLKLKAMHFQQKYFQFERKDERAKQKARTAAEGFKAEWEQRSGLSFMVVEGFFL
jgi:hypothetical protein